MKSAYVVIDRIIDQTGELEMRDIDPKTVSMSRKTLLRLNREMSPAPIMKKIFGLKIIFDETMGYGEVRVR